MFKAAALAGVRQAQQKRAEWSEDEIAEAYLQLMGYVGAHAVEYFVIVGRSVGLEPVEVIVALVACGGGAAFYRNARRARAAGAWWCPGTVRP